MIANISSIIAAHVHGLKLTIVAPAAVYDPKSPDAILAVAGNSPIHSAKDLVGKIVGVPSLNEINVCATRAWLDANRVDGKSVQFVEVPFSSMLAAIEQDRIQAGMLVKPFITDALSSGRARLLGLAFGAIAPKYLETAWIADSDFVGKHKPELLKFQRIVAVASAYTRASVRNDRSPCRLDGDHLGTSCPRFSNDYEDRPESRGDSACHQRLCEIRNNRPAIRCPRDYLRRLMI